MLKLLLTGYWFTYIPAGSNLVELPYPVTNWGRALAFDKTTF